MRCARMSLLVAALLLLASATAQARVSHGYSGIFSLDTVTAVGDDASRPPQTTALAAIYPNPFNPRTTIEFELAQTGVVELAIFDLRGRMVRVLASGIQPRGRDRVTWDGCDNTGRAVATGTYFCRLKTAEVSQIKKLTLAR